MYSQLMECGTKLVLEQVVTTIASVADTAEEKFVEYYDRFIPCLMYIIENANSNELRLLRGKTIECVSLIGLAVGAEKVRSKLFMLIIFRYSNFRFIVMYYITLL